MAVLEKVTPTHKAIETIKSTIKSLQLQLEALYATLPDEDETEESDGGVIVHPLTGKKGYYKFR